MKACPLFSLKRGKEIKIMSKKQCSKCKEWKEISNFHKEKSSSTGLRSECKICRKKYTDSRSKERKEYRSKYRATHKKELREYAIIYYANHKKERDEYYAKHREEILADKADYYAKHKKESHDWSVEYYKLNRDRIISRVSKYATEHKDNVIIYKANWYAKNKEKLHIRNAEWKINNKDKVAAYVKNRDLLEHNSGKGISLQDWKDILDKYGNRCLACGATDGLSIDHIIPLFKGGTHDPSNIQPLCLPCNVKKGTKTIDYRPNKQSK